MRKGCWGRWGRILWFGVLVSEVFSFFSFWVWRWVVVGDCLVLMVVNCYLGAGGKGGPERVSQCDVTLCSPR
jgi:hypothetical protein